MEEMIEEYAQLMVALLYASVIAGVFIQLAEAVM